MALNCAFMAQRCIQLHNALYCTSLHYTAVQYTVLHSALCCTAHGIALFCAALLYCFCHLLPCCSSVDVTSRSPGSYELNVGIFLSPFCLLFFYEGMMNEIFSTCVSSIHSQKCVTLQKLMTELNFF